MICNASRTTYNYLQCTTNYLPHSTLHKLTSADGLRAARRRQRLSQVEEIHKTAPPKRAPEPVEYEDDFEEVYEEDDFEDAEDDEE